MYSIGFRISTTRTPRWDVILINTLKQKYEPAYAEYRLTCLTLEGFLDSYACNLCDPGTYARL
jgi:hypothetical protein